MASIVVSGDTSGAITISAPATAGTNTLSLPANTGTAILDYSTPAYRNRIINGAMVIDQRNAGASVSATSGGQYFVDRWYAGISAASKFTAQQSSTAPAGFTKSLLITSSSAWTVGATDYATLNQIIEGFNTADFGWGASGAATVTLSFWVRSSLTGTFGGLVSNATNSAGPTRMYPFTYTISSANTFEYKTITIAGDTTGTWGNSNAGGITIQFSLAAGSSVVATAGSWTGAATYQGATGQTNLLATNNATWQVTGVQLEKGSTATSFDYRPYGTELMLCQRYYEFGGYYAQAANSPGGVVGSCVGYRATKRATPTVSGTATAGTGTTFNGFAIDYLQQVSIYAAPNGNGQIYGSWISSAEL